ncbi:MAG: hypothetical protein WCO65_01405 [bacterium]
MQKVKDNKIPVEFASDEIALRYLARILVQAFIDHKENERIKSDIKKKSGNLLSSINKGTS